MEVDKSKVADGMDLLVLNVVGFVQIRRDSFGEARNSGGSAVRSFWC